MAISVLIVEDDKNIQDLLQMYLEKEGYADEKPIYGQDGKVDNDASRRVSFRFIINLQQEA